VLRLPPGGVQETFGLRRPHLAIPRRRASSIRAPAEVAERAISPDPFDGMSDFDDILGPALYPSEYWGFRTRDRDLSFSAETRRVDTSFSRHVVLVAHGAAIPLRSMGLTYATLS